MFWEESASCTRSRALQSPDSWRVCHMCFVKTLMGKAGSKLSRLQAERWALITYWFGSRRGVLLDDCFGGTGCYCDSMYELV